MHLFDFERELLNPFVEKGLINNVGERKLRVNELDVGGGMLEGGFKNGLIRIGRTNNNFGG